LIAATKRQVLIRLLRNLQNAHLRQARFVAALEAVAKILHLQPDDATANHARRQIESLVSERKG